MQLAGALGECHHPIPVVCHQQDSDILLSLQIIKTLSAI